MSITVTSTSFPPHGPIPKKYTEDGENISPPLAWTGVPSGTVELALKKDGSPDPSVSASRKRDLPADRSA